jgi:hypothetical protein
MDTSQCLVLLRGQQAHRLYKIIPDEFPAFLRLRSTPVREYIPDWRKETEHSAQTQKADASPQALRSEPQKKTPAPPEPDIYDYDLVPPQEKEKVTDPEELGMVEKTLRDLRGDYKQGEEE